MEENNKMASNCRMSDYNYKQEKITRKETINQFANDFKAPAKDFLWEVGMICIVALGFGFFILLGMKHSQYVPAYKNPINYVEKNDFTNR